MGQLQIETITCIHSGQAVDSLSASYIQEGTVLTRIRLVRVRYSLGAPSLR